MRGERTPQRVRQLDNLFERGRIVERLRHPQRFHRCRSEMSGHHLAHQIVGHVAVEHGAKKRLTVSRQSRLQAEQRMRRHDARRQHRGDERETIGRARHVTIREACAENVVAASRSLPAARSEILARRVPLAHERPMCCPPAPACRSSGMKMRAVVGGVELATELHAPAVRRVQAGDGVNDAVEDAQVGLGAQLGIATCLGREPQ